MNALQEAEKALADFLANNDSCATCVFWTPKHIGGVCAAPEYPIGYLKDNTMTCEQHEFRGKKLKKQLSVLINKHYNALYIVEGFLYFDIPVM
ncbi:MAG: hypothetical protein LBU85_13180 [Treponema sp.]|jgi:hypothetical protein|nr:hypothetical protein [Treponema sp.]